MAKRGRTRQAHDEEVVAEEPLPYIKVRAVRTPHFQRCGLRFERDRPTVLAVRELEPGVLDRLCTEEMIQVAFIDEDEAQELLESSAAAAVEAGDVGALMAENESLKEQLADAQREISLLRGDRRIGKPVSSFARGEQMREPPEIVEIQPLPPAPGVEVVDPTPAPTKPAG